ncbi:PDZ domain-containing protein gipc3 [Dermatophagoides pteronyssinus]|uniref:PDZ domain-containing protein gipc3 n=1 Tax=Dermatophagoides pteronyssinus TaxID=6956 RepID=A0ABQ8JQM4_DERPT|nr:PDZ domain-containing protein gipc3 [Dermatophagoides pteronyssinus]
MTTSSMSFINDNNLIVKPKSLFQYFNPTSATYQVNPKPRQTTLLKRPKSSIISSYNTDTKLHDTIEIMHSEVKTFQNDDFNGHDVDDNDNSITKTDIVTQEICCLLAEGSPTCFISNFSSMIELYEKIAHCFDISAKEIMYCTLNTPKIDMDQVLCGQICLNDIVFVHRKGRRKDVEIKKTEQFLGLTIADNGYGCSYIKNIHQNSVVSKIPFIQVGDQIESIMEQNMIGNRHYEVANFLKSIQLNEIFTITLIEPIAAMGNNVQLRINNNNNNHENNNNNQMDPIMTNIKHHNDHQIINESNGKCTENCFDEIDDDDDDDNDNYNDRIVLYTGLYYINKQLEKFIGINDDELAEELWLMATTTTTTDNINDTIDHHHHNDIFSIEQSQQKQQKYNDDDEQNNHQNIENGHNNDDNNIVMLKNDSKLLRQPTKTPTEFTYSIQNSDLSDFKFTENFLFDIWSIVHDVLDGTLKLPS